MTQNLNATEKESDGVIWTLNLTKLEKKAVAYIMIDIAKADGKITGEESLLFEKMQRFIGITSVEIREALSMNAIDCLSIIKLIPVSIKEIIGKMMIEMIVIDGQIAKEEFDTCLLVCKYADIPLPNKLIK